MQTNYKKILDVLALGLIALVLIYWFKNGSPLSFMTGNNKIYTQYTQELLGNIDFFKKKVEDGNWVFATNLAALHMKAFRTTNDFAHIDKAEKAARLTLEHEEAASAYTILSSISLTNHEFDQALLLATQALNAAHTRDEKEQALAARFDAELALGAIASIQKTLEELQTLAPESYSTLTRHARLADRIDGDAKQAAELFDQACALVSQAEDLWNQAWCITQLETYRLYSGASPKTVEKNLTRITREIYPNFSLALALQGHIAASMHEYTKSERLYKKALVSNEIPEFYLELAELALLQNDSKKANEAWQDYLSIIGAHRIETNISNNAIIHVRGLTSALYGLGNTKEAFAEAEKDIIKRPNDPGSYQTLAILYMKEKKYSEALKASLHISDSVMLTGDEAMIRAIALSQTGKKEDAEKWFAYASSKKPALSLQVVRIQQRRP